MDNVAPVKTVTPGATSGSGSGTGVSSAERSLNSAVAGAVRTLNESGIIGEGREVTFSLDRATRRPVVQVVDTSTKEVINQWPPEYALRLAETTKGGAKIQDESVLRTNDLIG
jgi:uncharacterized FlaG/YvyC family protein